MILEQKLFTLEFINRGLMNINFQYMDDSIPTPLDSSCLADGSLRQNGSLMFILTLYQYNYIFSFSNVDFSQIFAFSHWKVYSL